MSLFAYIVMAFGGILAITGVVLFIRKGTEGTNIVKMLGFEFHLSGSALVIFVVGIVVFLQPITNPNNFRTEVQPTQYESLDKQKPPSEPLVNPSNEGVDVGNKMTITNGNRIFTKSFKAEIVTDPTDGNYSLLLHQGNVDKVKLNIGGEYVLGKIIIQDSDTILPNEKTLVVVKLQKPIPIKNGLKFKIVEADIDSIGDIGSGVVTEVNN